MLKGTIKSLTIAALLAASAISAQAADYTIRATANSNENDEDYDGLIVFKTMLRAPQTGQSKLNCLLVLSSVLKARNACKASRMDRLTSIFPPRAVRLVSSLMCRFWICLI